jgi:hypothetical protein
MAGVFQGNPFSNLPPLASSIPAGLQGGTLPLSFNPTSYWTRGSVTPGPGGAPQTPGQTPGSGTPPGLPGVDPSQLMNNSYSGGQYRAGGDLGAFRAAALEQNPNAQFARGFGRDNFLAAARAAGGLGAGGSPGVAGSGATLAPGRVSTIDPRILMALLMGQSGTQGGGETGTGNTGSGESPGIGGGIGP